MAAEMKLSTTPTSGKVSRVDAPPYFQAMMSRDAPIGALITLLIGFGMLGLKFFIFPDLNLNAWVIDAFNMINPEIGSYIGALFNVTTTADTNSAFFLMQFVYAAFLSFPANLSWLVGGILVSVIRVRRGRDQGPLRPGWDTFWYGMLAVEIPFMVFGIVFLFSSLDPGALALQGFSGSVLIYFLLFFLMPNFWIGLFMALFGSAIGTKIANK
ncbi:hypothetical protein GF325_15700 [Candidatus Bathyarchaeota archaeon]|nr:hypothetical protein [Candidatus Bathyarchaeota archaeon]